MPTCNDQPDGRLTRSLNNIVPLAAVATLALLLGRSMAGESTAVAGAQPQAEPLTTTPFNAAEQRKVMIEQLRLVNDRLGRIETKLAQPLDVRVKEMPPIVLPPAQAPPK